MPFDPKLQGHLQAAHKALIALGHETPEDFALAKDEDPTRRARYVSVEKLLFKLIATIRADLAPEHIHIGYSVLEAAVYDAIRTGVADPVAHVVTGMRSQNLHAPGFLIYPLYGFGLLRSPTGSFLQDRGDVQFVAPDFGVAVLAGPRDLDGLETALASVTSALGVVGKASHGDLRYYTADHEPTRWLVQNPLLVVRIKSITMGARENQGAYMNAVGHRVAYLMMCSVLLNPRDTNRTMARSTAGSNNYETLEFKHYMVFESAGTASAPMRVDRVPMNFTIGALRQLADAPVDVDPDLWNRSEFVGHLGGLADAFQDLEDLHEAVRNDAPITRSRSNVVRKIRTSLHWFRRSFASFADEREAVVAMAVAFEALLSDGYSAGVTKMVIARVRHCIDAQHADEALVTAVNELFEWRGAVVHNGQTKDAIDLSLARRAYTYCFVEVVARTASRNATHTMTLTELFDGVVMTFWDRLRRYLSQLKRALISF